jgi:galactofuranosylgalactofuranosylrhamnosyl-N-acetylglucosaminyl-diphospho-decaprenol beta-1,5/1,6-galactofuranosyltransferase
MPASSPITSDAAPARPAAERDDRLVEHTPSGRLVAQRGLFRGPDPVCPDDLYSQVVFGSAVRERQRLVVHAGSEVTMDTYFGRFPASYWQRWTVVNAADVEITASGSGRIAIVASDIEGETQDVTGLRGETVTLTAQLDKFVDGGFLWVQLTTGDDDLVVEKLRWTVEPPERLRPTAVVICTFNRADDCTKTLQSLGGDPEALDVLDAIYVVDQGSDTVESRAAFPDIEKALDGRLRYLRQPNLGGAGGFGRGMYEVTEAARITKDAEHANVLVMDDDVLCEPEIAIRLTAFANRTSDPTIIGGQMLRLLHPTRLIAGAEYADFAQLKPGRVVTNALDDADLLAEEVDEDGVPTGKVNRGDRRVDALYNAWWSCLIPAEVVAKIGLPLPLFFQWDDVEYGYRARKAGFATVTLPGAGLWHADFDWKDADKWNEYFAVRNSIIVSTLHSETDPKVTARVIAARVSRYLLTMQYGLAATIIKAVEDFQRGPGFLHDGGSGAAKEIFAVRREYPDTVMHKASEIPGLKSGTIPLIQAGPKPTRHRLVMAKRLAYLALGRTVHPVGAVSKEDSHWWHVSQFATAVVTDGSQEGVRLRKRDRETTVRLAKQTVKALRGLVSDMPRLREEYRAAVPELTSRANWRRLYGMAQRRD